MTAITNLITPTSTTGHARPFDLRRDLSRVADLVELCFAESLDPDGRRYLRQMRSAARNPGYLQWAGIVSERAVMPLSGYVWEEGTDLVGNLTLIPYYSLGQRYYLIANVAVHPNHRRRGIAVNLTRKAIEHARLRGAQAAWLHVREENEGAIDLYRSAGFVERARRTTWILENDLPSDAFFTPEYPKMDFKHSQIRVGARRSGDWSAQREWLRELYPPEVSWHFALQTNVLRPGISGYLYRIFNDVHVQQWSAYNGRQLLGILAWQETRAYADQLWLATSGEHENRAVEALLGYARLHRSAGRPLSLDYPGGRATGAIQSAGFQRSQTLIWMSLEL